MTERHAWEGNDAMHELSVAMNIIELVEEERDRRNGVKIASVRLRLGPLSGVVKSRAPGRVRPGPRGNGPS